MSERLRLYPNRSLLMKIAIKTVCQKKINANNIMTDLETIIKETRAAFIIAKSDGILDSSEVISIAVGLVQKIHKLTNLSGSEKKAILLHALKKGLADSGGLDTLAAFVNASPEVKKAFEDQILCSASAAVDLILDAAAGKLDLRKSFFDGFFACLNKVSVLQSNEQKLVKEAINTSKAYIKSDEITVDEVYSIVNEVKQPSE